MLSAEARAELARLFASRSEKEQPIESSRANWLDDVSRTHVLPDRVRVRDEAIAGVRCEWVEGPDAAPGRAYLQLHGGGYVNGSPRTHRRMAAHLALATSLPVVTPDYRLAPEHPFPAGLDDALAVYRGLRTRGLSGSDIVVGGDSAGGGLALSLLLALRAAGEPMPHAAILLSPWTDLTVSSPSYEMNRDLDPIITRRGLRRAAAWYAGGRDQTDPLLSPLFADLAGLPPLLVHAGSDEAMLDDSRVFAERAAAAGVAVTYKAFPGLWHVFHASGIEIPESRQAIDEIGAYLKTLQGE